MSQRLQGSYYRREKGDSGSLGPQGTSEHKANTLDSQVGTSGPWNIPDLAMVKAEVRMGVSGCPVGPHTSHQAPGLSGGG